MKNYICQGLHYSEILSNYIGPLNWLKTVNHTQYIITFILKILVLHQFETRASLICIAQYEG